MIDNLQENHLNKNINVKVHQLLYWKHIENMLPLVGVYFSCPVLELDNPKARQQFTA